MDAARVVPVIPSYSVDEGFWYSIPEPLEDRVVLGSMVRVPLSGRRTRGFVVQLDKRDSTKLRDIAQVSGRTPVLTAGLIESLRWAAKHYVAPVGPMLDRAAPPNVPPVEPKPDPPTDQERIDHPLADVVTGAASGARSGPIIVLDLDASALVNLAIDANAAAVNLVVIAPTAVEVTDLGTRMSEEGVSFMTVVPEHSDKEVTSVWRRTRHLNTVTIGTPRIASWPIRAPGIVVVVQESRRAMKERQSPTVAVRDLILARAQREGLVPIFAGPTPSAELVGTDAEIRKLGPRRLWPLVEVIDRRDDPPGRGLLGDPAKQAIRAVATSGSVFVYAHRTGYSAASRCVQCRTLRVCPTCGSRPDPGDDCARCGSAIGPCQNCGGTRFEPLGAGVGRLVEELGRVVDRSVVGPMDARRAVRVGTERDLSRLTPCDLAVMVDADGLVRGTNYRAAEEALRIGARIAGVVKPGGRMLLQTNDPTHPAIVALRRADPVEFHRHELEQRRLLGYPPAGQLMVIEARAMDDSETANSELVAIAGRATLLGPAPSANGVRWLVQGSDLTDFKSALRPVIERWRNGGATIRIDSDPIDL